jgi:uncharacterized membrane protein YwzB
VKINTFINKQEKCQIGENPPEVLILLFSVIIKIWGVTIYDQFFLDYGKYSTIVESFA